MNYNIWIKRGSSILSCEKLLGPKKGDIEASILKQVGDLRKKQALPDDWHADVRQV